MTDWERFRFFYRTEGNRNQKKKKEREEREEGKKLTVFRGTCYSLRVVGALERRKKAPGTTNGRGIAKKEKQKEKEEKESSATTERTPPKR